MSGSFCLRLRGLGVCDVGEGEINCKLQISTRSVNRRRMLLCGGANSPLFWVLILHIAIVRVCLLFGLLKINMEEKGVCLVLRKV